MTGPRTVALIKQVPLGDLGLDEQGRLARAGREAEMNPWCRRAAAQAIRLGPSTVITMGPPAAVDVAREALACGAGRAIHLTDPALAGADCLVTAQALAAAVTKLGPVDLVLVGRSSTDGSTSAVGAMVAELLGLPFIGPALEITVDGTALHTKLQHDGGLENVTVTLPAVVAVAERSCTGAKAAPDTWPAPDAVEQWTTADLGRPVPRGQDSPTAVLGVRAMARSRRRLMFSGSLAEQARQALDALDLAPGTDKPVATVPRSPDPRRLSRANPVLVVSDGRDERGTQALLGEAALLAEGRVIAICPRVPAPMLVSWGADETAELSEREPRPVAEALAGWIRRNGMPGAILGGTSSWDQEVLSRLAVRLDAGLMSDLIGLHKRDGALVGIKPTGNGLLAEIVSRSATQLATVRTGSLELREPRESGESFWHAIAVDAEPSIVRHDWLAEDDYDALERAETVVGVGRGVDPSDYGKLEPLLTLFGAQLAATRKVTDQAWLPHSRQVGITARGIAPRRYFAIGISGNFNHVSGVGRAGTIFAINSDPSAPIFEHSDIGIVGDWRLVLPVLLAELRRRPAAASVRG